jgi:hypothetical protein
MGRQMMRAATSVAANYRAACRARSHAEFVAKIGVVVEEIDETVFWLEMLVDAGVVPRPTLFSHGRGKGASGYFRRFAANSAKNSQTCHRFHRNNQAMSQ